MYAVGADYLRRGAGAAGGGGGGFKFCFAATTTRLSGSPPGMIADGCVASVLGTACTERIYSPSAGGVGEFAHFVR